MPAHDPRRLAWHQVQAGAALLALGRPANAAPMLNAAVLDLTALVDDTTVGRDALLALAEAQALLALLFGPSAPEPALAHRAAAIAALQRAQAWHPPGRLGQDHLSLLARLEDAVITGEADQG